jgi:hypothetical protein
MKNVLWRTTTTNRVWIRVTSFHVTFLLFRIKFRPKQLAFLPFKSILAFWIEEHRKLSFIREYIWLWHATESGHPTEKSISGTFFMSESSDSKWWELFFTQSEGRNWSALLTLVIVLFPSPKQTAVIEIPYVSVRERHTVSAFDTLFRRAHQSLREQIISKLLYTPNNAGVQEETKVLRHRKITGES